MKRIYKMLSGNQFNYFV